LRPCLIASPYICIVRRFASCIPENPAKIVRQDSLGRSMPDSSSALQLVFGGDPALYSIVALSIYVSVSAVLLAALVALPFGAFLALVKFPGRAFVVVVVNAFMGLPPVVG